MMRNEAFSILRWLFVVCIVGYHFAPTGLRASFWPFSGGQIVVSFFFVLSGFLSHHSTRGRWGGAADFYRRKASSLGPLYYASLAVCIAIEVRNARFPVPVILADSTLLQAWVPGLQMGLNPPAWFMSALVFCLGVYPLIRRVAGGRQVIGCALAYWLLVQGSACLLAGLRIEPIALYWVYFPLFHLSSFWIGIAAGEYAAASKAPVSDRSRITWFVVTLTGVIACLRLIDEAPQMVRHLATISLFAPVFACLVFSVARLPESWIRSIDKTGVNVLGRLVFPVYLLQVPVFKVFERLFIAPGHGSMSATQFAVYFVLLAALGLLWVALAEPVLRRVGAARPTAR